MEDILKQAAEYERTYSIAGRAHYIVSDQSVSETDGLAFQ